MCLMLQPKKTKVRKAALAVTKAAKGILCAVDHQPDGACPLPLI